jgi:precorrin-2 dehydrogenase/sirohydrochlorin ferrochelatase
VTRYYPLMLDLKNIKCLVIGGGEVAKRKVYSLWECGADITLVSPEIVSGLMELAERKKITYLKRKYQRGETRGFSLVFVATPDPEVSRQVAEEAKTAGIFCNIADAPSLGNFIVPARIQRGDLSICVSTNGKSPLLAKKIRIDLENNFGPEYAKLLELMESERKEALEKIPEGVKRKELFEKLVYSDILRLIKEGQDQEVKKLVENIWQQVFS